MMGYDYAGGGGVWMWVVGGLMMIGVVFLIGAVAWAVIAVNNRGKPGPTATADTGGRARTRQVLDEGYARGEMNSEEYTKRLHTLGL